MKDEDLIVKLALGVPLSEVDIEDGLRSICVDVHSSCDSTCPVYRLNGGDAPDTKPDNRGCDCFKNGKAMLSFIREKFQQ